MRPDLSYTIRRSHRAKYTRIVVKPGAIEVVAPIQICDEQIRAFVVLQQGWIRNALRRVEDKAAAAPTITPRCYEDGVAVPYQGRQIPLRVSHIQTGATRIRWLDENQLHISVPADTTQPSNDIIKQALERWMKNQARRQALLLMEKHQHAHHLHPRSLKIKTQKSRWGSCGPHNDINLNWLLMLAPPAVFEYVVVHELCHIRHKNHSKDFWGLVEAHLPEYQQHRQWLKQHGASLMAGL